MFATFRGLEAGHVKSQRQKVTLSSQPNFRSEISSWVSAGLQGFCSFSSYGLDPTLGQLRGGMT